MALVRCVDEIMYKGLWAIAHASEDEAGKIYNGKEFPLKMGQLVTQVDVAFDTKDYFQTMKKNNWQVQNSFTHAGMMQFRRRVKGNRLEDNYPEEELKLALRMTLISAVLLAIPYVEMCGNPTATIQLKLVFKLLTDQLQTITDTPEQVRFE